MSSHESDQTTEQNFFEKYGYRFCSMELEESPIYADRSIDEDDIRQDNALAVLEAVRNSDQARPVKDVLSYVYNRVLWRCNNRLRDAHRRSDRPEYCSVPVEVLLDAPVHDKIPVEEDEMRQEIVNCVGTLTGRGFLILCLRHSQEEMRTFGEIAEELDISANNAKVIAHRAYKRIRHSPAGQAYRETYLVD